MKEINIGRKLIENRHKRGITQDELAQFIGVSKASVSKWETSTTYPDITLLPKLATFFDISIDELMNYEPQMTKLEIRNLYRQLSLDFATCSFEDVMHHCRDIAKQYYSCTPLLFQIAMLYVNHCMLAGNEENIQDIIEEAKAIFVRVKQESNDLELVKQAQCMEGFCLLRQGRENDVIDLLEPKKASITSTEPLLAEAYRIAGNMKEAKKILQVGIYHSISELLSFLSSYMSLCVDDVAVYEETYQRVSKIIEAFHLDILNPSSLLSFYVSAAQGFMALGNEEKALDMLEEYSALATKGVFPLQLHGDVFFTLLDDWLEDSLPLGNDLPRDEFIVRKSIVESVIDNPIFLPLTNTVRFQTIVKQLYTIKENI